MADQKEGLTASNIKYLLVIKELDKEGRGVRCTDVAEALGITKPSVHTMVNTLKALELISKDRYSVIRFTPEGGKLAEEYSRCFRAVSGHFGDIFPDPVQLRPAICAMLAEIPEGSMKILLNSENGGSNECSNIRRQ